MVLAFFLFCQFQIHDSVFFIVGEKYGIDPLLLKAIAIVESRQTPALGFNKNGTIDYGVMQINTFWVEKWNLSRARLLFDPFYAVETSAKILQICFREHGYNWNAVGYYHSPNPKRRKEYAYKVLREYAKLKKEFSKQYVYGVRQ